MQLDTDNDFVAIIDFLPHADRTTHRLSQKLMTYLAKNGIEQNCITCDTRLALLTALKWLAAQSQKGKKFLLQFVGHDGLNGLETPLGDPEKSTRWQVGDGKNGEQGEQATKLSPNQRQLRSFI